MKRTWLTVLWMFAFFGVGLVLSFMFLVVVVGSISSNVSMASPETQYGMLVVGLVELLFLIGLPIVALILGICGKLPGTQRKIELAETQPVATQFAPLSKPKQVRIAVAIVYVGVGLALLRYMLDFTGHSTDATVRAGWMPGVIFVVGSAVFTVSLAMTVFLIEMTRRRHDWARVTGLVLFVLFLPLYTFQKIHAFGHHPFSVIAGVVIDFLDIAALVLLFQRDSTAWFRAERASL